MTAIWTALSAALLVLVSVPLAYLYLLLLGALRGPAPAVGGRAQTRFAVAIPAHDEVTVIEETVAALRRIDYPADLFDLYVVADHCRDDTAERARQAGAICFERRGGPRGGKAAAVTWLLERIWETGKPYDAVVLFDADTLVDAGFLRAVDARLAQGDAAVQGRHRIRNPRDGWYPALSWTMFVLDNRFNNQGRTNLGLSAKNMGDSICLRSDLLRRVGWGEGLTEDYDLRLRLLESGVRIAYEPAAAASGEAPANWAVARRQRERWLVGTFRSSRSHLARVLRLGMRRRDPALMDAAAQMVLPTYSTLTIVSAAALAVQAGVNAVWSGTIAGGLLGAWAAALGLLVAYPLIGLALERAPWWAFLVSLSGPAFVLWRTVLAVSSRFGGRAIEWVRTPRRGSREPAADDG